MNSVQEKMDRIVGKYFILLLVSFVSSSYATIELRALSMNGEVFEQAEVGQPFILEVMVSDSGGSLQVPAIKGLERFSAKRTGLYMSSINGKSTTKYTYQVRIDKSGTYEIGPAVADYNGNAMQSELLTVAVGDSHVTGKQKKGASRASKKALLRLSVDSNDVVVGQKVSGRLRFYYNDSSLELKHISQPDMIGFMVKNSRGPRTGKAQVNNASYYYAEWGWDLYPTKAGELIIPAYSADFAIPSKRDHFFGGFSILLGSRTERKRVYSNAVKLHVDALPAYDGHVHAIGKFERLRATIKPGVAKEGEGMVLTLEVEGDGNLEEMQSPTMHGIPKELKYYDSNSIVINPESANDIPKKQFEFIVQGIACGDWEIPKQSFTYFDIVTRSYKSLYSAPLMVTIVPGTGAKTLKVSSHYTRGNKFNSEDDDTNKLLPINTKGPWYPTHERSSLPWWLFNVCAALPLIFLVVPRMQRRVRVRFKNRPSKKRIFSTARTQLKNASAQDVYTIFIQLIADYFGKSRAQISPEDIETYLYNTALSEHDIMLWRQFFDRVSQVAFGTEKTKRMPKEFFKVAEQWIDRLEKVLQ